MGSMKEWGCFWVGNVAEIVRSSAATGGGDEDGTDVRGDDEGGSGVEGIGGKNGEGAEDVEDEWPGVLARDGAIVDVDEDARGTIKVDEDPAQSMTVDDDPKSDGVDKGREGSKGWAGWTVELSLQLDSSSVSGVRDSKSSSSSSEYFVTDSSSSRSFRSRVDEEGVGC